MSRIYLIITVFLFCFSLQAEKLKVKPLSIEILVDNALRIPGKAFSIGIEAILPDSSIKITKNFGGKLNYKNFVVTVVGGTYSRGKVKLQNFRFKNPEIFVRCRKYPELEASLKIPLHKETEILVKTTQMGAAAPGEAYKMDIISTFNDGYSYSVNNREIPREHYAINVNGGSYASGTICVSNNIDRIKDHRVSITVKPMSQSMAPIKKFIRLNYKKDYQFISRSHSGSNGSDGDKGREITVHIEAYYDEILLTDLMEVHISDRYSERKILVNPKGGSLKIVSRGGNGGSGVKGADGEEGTEGTMGSTYTETIFVNDSTSRVVTKRNPGGNGGNGGNGAVGGSGGNGGDGGDIHIYHNEYATPYINKIIAESFAGNGGSGGAGGKGGAGGNGGIGNPRGRDGTDGCDGANGPSGSRGRKGEVFFYIIDD